MSLMYDST